MTEQPGSLTDPVSLLWQTCGDDVKADRESYYVDRYLFPEDVHGLRLLDVGGGQGSLGLYIHIARGGMVDILDEYEGHGSHASNLQKLLGRLDQLGISDINVMQGDVREAAVAPGSYDGIYMRNALHHVFDKESDTDGDVTATMARFWEWLVPGGSLIIGEVGWLLAWRLVSPLRHRVFPGMEYTSKSGFRRWRRCAEMAGFVFTDVKWYVPYRFRRWYSLLGNELANVFLTGAYVLRMRKPQNRGG